MKSQKSEMPSVLTTKQVKKQSKTLRNGNPINVAAQFGKPGGNPRHNGAWKKEDTVRYKLEQMMKMTRDELLQVNADSLAPYFERKIASCIIDGDWKTIESMINQVYGQPKQPVVAEVSEYKPLIDLTKRKKNGAK